MDGMGWVGWVARSVDAKGRKPWHSSIHGASFLPCPDPRNPTHPQQPTDVVNVEQAKIAEEAGAVAVMALERIPADIRRDGGVARMSDPAMIKEIKAAVTIPVMAKVRWKGGRETGGRGLGWMGWLGCGGKWSGEDDNV